MSHDKETFGSALMDESCPVSAATQRDITVEEVLLWEAT